MITYRSPSQRPVSNSPVEVRWRDRSRASGAARLLVRGGVLLAVQRWHGCRLPEAPAQVRWRVAGRTTEFGQKILVGLVAEDEGSGGRAGCGLGVLIDPETGRVDDVMGEGGVVGYVESAPQGVGSAVELEVEAWLYGRTLISRLRVNGEAVALPAVLVRPGQGLMAVVGGEIGSGSLPVVEHSELVLRPLAGDRLAHG